MSIYFMFGKYTSESIQEVSPERTKEIVAIAERFGGTITSMYVLMGAYDLVLIGKFPNMEEALQASVSITKNLGISFSTLPAMPVTEFDQLIK